MTEINRRLANSMQFGVVEKVNYGTAKARVRVGDLLTGWLSMMANRAGGNRSWSPFEIGEQVVILAPSGDLAGGVILGAIYTDTNGAPSDSADVHRVTYGDGSVVEYDRGANHLKIHLGGGTAEIVAPGGIAVTGTITVNGDVVADGVSLKTHTHGGVLPGPANTAGPN